MNSPMSAVGVILFGSSAYIQFNLQTYTSLSSLLSAINQLPYGSGGTDTAEALTLLLSAAQNGLLGLRSDSSKAVIVITDGQSNSPSATLSAAAALHASNIFEIYAVGIDGAYVPELERIASIPEFVFFTDSFTSDGMHKLQERILPQLCNGMYVSSQCVKNFIFKHYLFFILAGFLNITLQPSDFDQITIGQRQDVICSVSLPPDVNPNTIELGWLNEGDIVTNDSRVNANAYSNDSYLFTIIRFDPLFKEDEDEYICYAVINGSLVFESVYLENITSK